MDRGDGVTPDELLTDAFGSISAEDTLVVTRTLSCLGITAAPKGQSQYHELALSISIESEAAPGNLHIQFDVNTKRWRVMSPSDDISDQASYGSLDHRRHNPQDPHKQTSSKGRLCEDWIDQLPPADHIEFLKNTDWASTSLGPMRDWPYSLRLMTLKMLADPRAANLYCRHPEMMGSAARDAMPATWPFLSQVFDGIEQSGVAFSTSRFDMCVEKTAGFLEEAWYDGVFSPLRDDDGRIQGIYNSGFEITDHEMSDRRHRLLNQIGATPNLHKTSVWQHILDACLPFERDITMLVGYSATEDSNNKSHRCFLQLVGALGFEKDHEAIPQSLEIHDGDSGFAPAFRSAKAQGTPILLEMSDGRLPDFLTKGVQWRGFEDPATHIAIIPRFATGMIAGFLAVGLDPRRPYDEAHAQFVKDIAIVSTAVLSSSISNEQARAREAKLSKELTEREKYIRRLAEVATVGICNLSSNGAVTWANSKYYTMTGMSGRPEDAYNLSFVEQILEEDQPKALPAYRDSLLHKTAKDVDIRLKKKWRPPGLASEEYCWILTSFLANIEEGEVEGVLGCITDISRLKWAEQVSANTADAATEAKRQQERFIDMTSHEMRNPLSAIMQCADSISSSVEQSKHSYAADQALSELLESMRESAQTIMFCAAHQKRIIDDILAVSKLDSSMLAITPVLVEPLVVLQQVMQMFEAELAVCDITSSYTASQSYHDLETKWVYCDPSRLTQILVNLLTNSIKFTKTSDRRELHVEVDVSTVPPFTNSTELRWFPSQRSRHASDPPESCAGDDIYLMFTVRDTGRGISPDEMSILFNRFSQANPKTHVQYGGSGLGLFISRELTELQGGMIGCRSTLGEGSVFAIYIKARRPMMSDIPAPMAPPASSQREARPTSPESAPEILLVEDNLVNQKVLYKQLQRLGCTVHVANHGLEALEFIQKTRFWQPNHGSGLNLSVVLMDWEMPVMDGLTCTKRLRDLEQQHMITEHLKVIATTANARKEQVQMALAAGVVGSRAID
ncbi:hypothetical protein LTR28_008493 [Elasticomyces elasticus]|nr:hypothetical protein LTR28_008493 [Elasticomyces elasticus]